jgi:hypothetical protein
MSFLCEKFNNEEFYLLNMEATYSSESSVGFQRTIGRYVPKDRILHNTAARISVPTNLVFIDFNIVLGGAYIIDLCGPK